MRIYFAGSGGAGLKRNKTFIDLGVTPVARREDGRKSNAEDTEE
jgi:hypothetical protein